MNLELSRAFSGQKSEINVKEISCVENLKQAYAILSRKAPESIEKAQILEGIKSAISGELEKNTICYKLEEVNDIAIKKLAEEAGVDSEDEYSVIYYTVLFNEKYKESYDSLVYWAEPKSISNEDFMRRQEYINKERFPDNWFKNFMDLFLSKIYLAALDSID